MTRRYHPYRRRGGVPARSLNALFLRRLRQAQRAHAAISPGHKLKVLVFRSPFRDSFELWCATCWKTKGHVDASEVVAQVLELYRAGAHLLPRAWRHNSSS